MPKPGRVRPCLVALVAAYLAFQGALLLGASPLTPSLPKVESTRNFACQRQYRVTASVTVLSVPVFYRSGVGFGSATAEEQTNGRERSISLRFLGSSIPERARGLNRFGLIQENVRQVDRAVVGIDYLGLVTANEEESFKDAKSALDPTSDQARFILGRASVNRDETRYVTKRVLLSSRYRSSSADQLLRQAEKEFAALRPDQMHKVEVWKGQPISTFLCALREMMRSDETSFDKQIIFNSGTFRLQASKHPDAKTGEELA